MVRATTDNDPSLTLLSVDGIGAYDHVFRSSMLGRLLEMPRARALLPFVRMSHAQPSQYSWVDEEGRHPIINQAEGGEQGDPLMPLLFSIGIQQALEEVAAAMLAGEQLSAFPRRYLLALPTRQGGSVVQAVGGGPVEERRNRVASGEDQNLEQGRSCARQHWRDGR